MYVLFQFLLFFFARLTDEFWFLFLVLPIYRAAQWSFHLANPPSGTQTVPIKEGGHIIFVFMCIVAIYLFFYLCLGHLQLALQAQQSSEFSWPVIFWGIVDSCMAHDPSGSLDLKFGKTTENA
jgi:hypothetical protein